MDYILSLIIGIMMTFSNKLILDIFFEKRRTSAILTICSYSLLLVTITAVEITARTSYWQDINIIFNAVVHLVALFIITLNYESFTVKRLAAVGCTMILSHTVGSVFLFLVPLFMPDTGMNVHVFASNVSLLLVAILLRRLKNIKKDVIDSHIIWIPALVIPTARITTIILIGLDVPHASGINTISHWMGISILTFYLYNTISGAFESKLKSALHAQEKDYYFTQCQLMQDSVENIKSIRHDMKFHLAVARDLTANNRADEATDYLNNLLGNIEKNEIYSNTKNIAFDSIINFKLNNSEQENIQLDIRLLIPPSLNIEVADIVTILGNLLDNALDAVSKVDNKMIKLDIEYSRESLFIQVKNTFDGVVNYADCTNGEEKRVLTRKNSGEHGHGLRNIRKSVEKYNGHIDISHDDNIFSVGMFLYLESV